MGLVSNETRSYDTKNKTSERNYLIQKGRYKNFIIVAPVTPNFPRHMLLVGVVVSLPVIERFYSETKNLVLQFPTRVLTPYMQQTGKCGQ